MYIHLGLAGVGTIAMIVLGIYFMMESSEIRARIKDLDGGEMGTVLQALNAGSTWYAAGLIGLCVSKFDGKGCTECVLLIACVVTLSPFTGCRDVESTKQLMSDGSQTYGIICIVVSALVILTMITGGQVLHKTKREFQDRETERAGRRMALSSRYLTDGQQEWMQEDVEVIPEMRMPQSQPQEIQMANLGKM